MGKAIDGFAIPHLKCSLESEASTPTTPRSKTPSTPTSESALDQYLIKRMEDDSRNNQCEQAIKARTSHLIHFYLIMHFY